MNPETIVPLVTELKWPLVILVMLVLFRKPLVELFGRLTNLSISAGDFKLESALEGRVSPEVMKQLRKQPRLAGPREAESTQATILYMETRGYTLLYEALSPTDLARYLHSYLTSMTEIIFKYGGTVDRYEGIAITAYWGAPIQYPDSAARACKAALEMQQRIRELSPQLETQGFPPLLPQFAITTADVVVGDLGSDQKPGYSMVGDYQHILEGLLRLNINFQTSILITEFTYKVLQDRELLGEFEMRMLAEELQTRGKDIPISVYELCDSDG